MVKTFKTPAAKKLCSIVLAAAMFVSLTLSSSLYVSAEEEPAGNVHELTVSAEEVLAAIESGTTPLGESGLPALPTDEDRIPQEAGPVNGESALVNGASAVAGEPQVPKTAALIDRIDIPFGSSNLRNDLLEHLENNLPVRFFDHDDIGCSDCQALVTVSPETKQVSIIAINASEDETHTFRLTIADKDNVPLTLQDVSKEATNAEIKVFEGDIDNADIPKGVQVEILDITTEQPKDTTPSGSKQEASENSTSSSSQPAVSENASSTQSVAVSEEVASESVPSAESSDIPVEIASEPEAEPLPLLAAFSAAFENTFTEQANATGVEEETLYKKTSYEPSIEALSADISAEDTFAETNSETSSIDSSTEGAPSDTSLEASSEDANSEVSSIDTSSETTSEDTSSEEITSSDVSSQESSSSEITSSQDEPSQSSSEETESSEPANEPVVPGDSEIVKTTALLISTATDSMGVSAFDKTPVAVKSGITTVIATSRIFLNDIVVHTRLTEDSICYSAWHGNPTFVYTLDKISLLDKTVYKSQLATFSTQDTAPKTLKFENLTPGLYALTQSNPMRYELSCSGDYDYKEGNTVYIAILLRDRSVTFTNKKISYDWLSGTDVVINHITISDK